jgi:hypothetical protein
MAITSFNRYWVGTSAEAAFGQSLGMTMRYLVICDNGETDDVLTVLNDFRCPVRGAEVNIRGQLWYVNRVSVESPDESNRIRYQVTAELLDQLPNDASDSIDSPPGGAKQNPIDDEAVVEFDSGSMFKPVERDEDDKLIANSAGDRFEPRLKKFLASPTVSVTINQLTNPWAVTREYVGKTNENTWNGAASETVLLRALRARFRVRNGIPFWQCTYTFEFREDKWTEELWDAGKNAIVERDAATADNTRVKTKEPISVGGYPTQEDQPLNGKGEYITPQQLADGTAYSFLTFRIQGRANFDNLNITLPA